LQLGGVSLPDYMINGEFSEQVSVQDRGMHYGDGVFETLVANNGELEHWNDHINRLALGCNRLGINMPDVSLLKFEVEKLLDQQSAEVSRFVIKIIITRGIGQRGYKPPATAVTTRIVSIYPYPDYPEIYFNKGVKVVVCKIPLSCNPVLAGIKHLNRLEQVMAQSEWDDPQIIDGIMLNNEQQVVECTMSNIFWASNNQLFTPDLSNCGVEGVTRANILRLAKELQIPTKIGNFSVKDLLAADEIFISNSVFGIFPVNKIEDCEKQPGSITRRLMTKLS